jgi:hypothetical protein
MITKEKSPIAASAGFVRAGCAVSWSVRGALIRAWLPAAERRRYALTGPPPPDWHTQMLPAPWINPRVLAEGRKLAGASLVTIPASPVPALAAVPVPPGQEASPPAETPSGVPPWDSTTAQAEALADPVTSGGDDLITGIAAAAGYLGYDKPDSFRRARTATPSPAKPAPSTVGPHGHPLPSALGMLSVTRVTALPTVSPAKDRCVCRCLSKVAVVRIGCRIPLLHGGSRSAGTSLAACLSSHAAGSGPGDAADVREVRFADFGAGGGYFPSAPGAGRRPRRQGHSLRNRTRRGGLPR